MVMERNNSEIGEGQQSASSAKVIRSKSRDSS
ncbi:Os08g0153550 [Oryza sativa Japonica Group]|uniref:Os08g0153550 protein n=1 Tax=Oryza sativa subsp. japonica TaxID=39947 RepID=C7J5X5_ORYSJ|nr:Os08g0153550 [Oryza sativa Japonica Group]|eukprot:NP_001175385.1 Os08g0153550 [Oryza sativa Japonica Group]